jgi:hypothetical protein
VEGPAASGRKREGQLRVNFEGRHVATVLTEKGAVGAWSSSNSSEGRRFDDRRWTRGKYTYRGVSWGCPWAAGLVRKGGGGWGRFRWLLAEVGEKEERGSARRVGEEEIGV